MKLLKQVMALALLIFSVHAWADVQAGRDYTVLNPSQPTHTGNKVEVLEFFFYGCQHCYHLHPYMTSWEKKIPGDVELNYVPVIFRDSWEGMARAFYALKSIGEQNKLHDALFKAWNVDDINLIDESEITNFVAQHGVDRNKFQAAYSSFAVNSKIARSNQMLQDYGIRGTPTLVVDGKYVITGLQPAETIKVLDAVIDIARKERGKH